MLPRSRSCSDQPGIVAGVQADGRFIQHVEHAGEIGAELSGQADALGLAAGEGGGGAVELEVAQADPVHKAQALFDLGQQFVEDRLGALGGFDCFECLQQPGWCAGEQLGQGDARGSA